MEKQEVHTTEKNEKPSIFKVIWKPAEQFAKVRRNPVILVPMLILLAVYAIGTYMTASVVDYAVYFEEEGIKIGPEMEPILNVIASLLVMFVSLITLAIIILITAAVYLAISKIAKKDVTFKQLFSMSTHLAIIGAIGILLNGLIAFATGDESTMAMYTSLAFLMGSDNEVLMGIELFSIWGTLITPIALQKVAGYSKGLSWAVTIAFFILGLLFSYATMVMNTLADMM